MHISVFSMEATMWSKIHGMWFPFLTTALKWAGLGLLGRDRTDQMVVPGRARAETTPMLSIGLYIYIYTR
jgi:hypothetical protein